MYCTIGTPLLLLLKVFIEFCFPAPKFDCPFPGCTSKVIGINDHFYKVHGDATKEQKKQYYEDLKKKGYHRKQYRKKGTLLIKSLPFLSTFGLRYIMSSD